MAGNRSLKVTAPIRAARASKSYRSLTFAARWAGPRVFITFGGAQRQGHSKGRATGRGSDCSPRGPTVVLKKAGVAAVAAWR
jgi:hypothetical protein